MFSSEYHPKTKEHPRLLVANVVIKLGKEGKCAAYDYQP
jgi:hypothetical protein